MKPAPFEYVAVNSWDEALAQGHRVARAHGTLVLVKGGHLTGDRTPDALVGPDAPEPLVAFDGARVPTENSHGTGCSLSSALATLQARHGDWPRSLRIARASLSAFGCGRRH